MAEARCYRLFDLVVRSGIELPELAPAADGAPADVEIRRGDIAPAEGEAAGFNILAGGALLNVPEVGRFAVLGGREVVVESADGASERNQRLYLLGSVMGALLHQRRLLPLHANAIVLGGRAVAFCGHSGAGKSTVAAWFHDRGDPVLADDVCAIAASGGGALALPGVPRLRLWRDALEKGGRSAADYSRSFESMDKWDVPTRQAQAAAAPVPLDRIYVLAKAEAPIDGPVIRRLSGIDGVNALVANTYRGRYVQIAGLTASHLATCLAVARAVPIFEAVRSWDLDAFDAEAARLREHACSPVED
jgi:hypothetical protein